VVSIHEEDDDDTAMVDDDEVSCVDMSCCKQLFGKKNQLYACGLCVTLMLHMAKTNASLGIRGLVAKLEESLDNAGVCYQFLQGLQDQEVLHHSALHPQCRG